MIRKINFITLLILFVSCSKYTRITDIRIQNNLQIDSISLLHLKKYKKNCYENYINNIENKLEIYETCFIKDSLSVKLGNKEVYSKINGDYNGSGCKLILQDRTVNKEKILKIKYINNNKQFSVKVPPKVKRVVILSNLKENYIKVTFFRFTIKEYYEILCR